MDGYSQREWEEKKRRDQEWAETTFKWNNERRPLLAELRTLTSLHRADFPELAELVENSEWERGLPTELIWGRIRCTALDAADRIDSVRTGSRGGPRPSKLVDPILISSVVGAVGRKAGRSDKLADKMRKRNHAVEKIAGKNHCQRADAIAMFPRHKQRIEEIQ